MTEPKWKTDTEYIGHIEDLINRKEVQQLSSILNIILQPDLNIPLVCLTEVTELLKSSAGMHVQQPEQVCYMICFTMTGEQRSLMKERMPMYIQEWLVKMLKN